MKNFYFLQNSSNFSPSQIILFPKECNLLDYKTEALSRKKNCISAIQNCKQATVRNNTASKINKYKICTQIALILKNLLGKHWQGFKWVWYDPIKSYRIRRNAVSTMSSNYRKSSLSAMSSTSRMSSIYRLSSIYGQPGNKGNMSCHR